jgi:hypothetical protein
MKKRLLARRPSPAMIVALVALCSSLTGGAFAAALIDGGDIQNGSITKKDLKNNSVNSKKVKNQTLLADDFAPGQLQGVPGLQGERGPSDVYTAGRGNDADSKPPLTKDVPAGTYFVMAQVVYSAPTEANAATLCGLGGGSNASQVFGDLSTTGHRQETLVATTVTTFENPGTIRWACNPASATAGNAALHAVKVGERH